MGLDCQGNSERPTQGVLTTRGCKPFSSFLSHPLIPRGYPAYPSLHKLGVRCVLSPCPSSAVTLTHSHGYRNYMYLSVLGAGLLYISIFTPFFPVMSTDLPLWSQVSSSPCLFP